jgi:hypothetical protein
VKGQAGVVLVNDSRGNFARDDFGKYGAHPTTLPVERRLQQPGGFDEPFVQHLGP